MSLYSYIGTIIAETDKAVLIESSISNAKKWIPNAVILDTIILNRRAKVEVVVKKWFYLKNH